MIPYSHDMGRQGGRERFPPLPLLRDEEVIQEQPDQAALTERYVEESVRFIREKRDRPFLIYLAHMYVHLPIYASEKFLSRSKNGPYGAGVQCVDWAMGVLLWELQRLGLDRNTLTIFTSDNGSRGDHGGSNAPLRGTKGTCWDGGQRVPCIMRWPGQIPAGRTCSELAASIDFLPTFAGLAGTKAPADRIIDGRDICPLVRGEPGATSPHDAFFYYLCDDLEAVRSGKWKLHVSRLNRPAKRREDVCELYDLERDIGETNNVAARYPEIVKELQAKAAACREDLGDKGRGIPGANCRPIGQVPQGRPLTTYDPQHPYIDAMYDIGDAG